MHYTVNIATELPVTTIYSEKITQATTQPTEPPMNTGSVPEETTQQTKSPMTTSPGSMPRQTTQLDEATPNKPTEPPTELPDNGLL